jgi:hypothetical protein
MRAGLMEISSASCSCTKARQDKEKARQGKARGYIKGEPDVHLRQDMQERQGYYSETKMKIGKIKGKARHTKDGY